MKSKSHLFKPFKILVGYLSVIKLICFSGCTGKRLCLKVVWEAVAARGAHLMSILHLTMYRDDIPRWPDDYYYISPSESRRHAVQAFSNRVPLVYKKG